VSFCGLCCQFGGLNVSLGFVVFWWVTRCWVHFGGVCLLFYGGGVVGFGYRAMLSVLLGTGWWVFLCGYGLSVFKSTFGGLGRGWCA